MEKELMKEAMHDACIRAVTEISADVKALVQAALDRETNETAKSMLSSMLENLDIAKAQDKAVCQSRDIRPPGFPMAITISRLSQKRPSQKHLAKLPKKAISVRVS